MFKCETKKRKNVCVMARVTERRVPISENNIREEVPVPELAREER